jgi:hypothetical protein
MVIFAPRSPDPLQQISGAVDVLYIDAVDEDTNQEVRDIIRHVAP